MALNAGDRLGLYEIVAPLGAGGMGEVYRARDTSLKREVALKVLPEEVSRDPDRQARFQREAELLAALNHPNIAAVYGLEQSTSATGIILELVEGDTLSDLIARGPLPLADALAIAGQIADALEAAHERGVIHRDLKPANIKLTPNGTIKVLDFGLAKMLDASSGTGMSGGPGAFSPTMSPTLSVHATYAGAILGTAAYMSPEQARGRAVDKRTDIWAFGCLMFEMLTGARPFEGEDVAETIGAVIHKEPAWHNLPATTPPSMRTALQRCLVKDAKQRVRDIGDVRLLMTGAFESVVPSPAAASSVAIDRPGVCWWWPVPSDWPLPRPAPPGWLKPSVPRADIARFTVSPPGKLVLAANSPTGRDIAISPDGTRVVYHVGDSPLTSQLLARDINQLDAVVLSGLTAPSSPFFSPDGRWMRICVAGRLEEGADCRRTVDLGVQVRGDASGRDMGPRRYDRLRDQQHQFGAVHRAGRRRRAESAHDTRCQPGRDRSHLSFLPAGRASCAVHDCADRRRHARRRCRRCARPGDGAKEGPDPRRRGRRVRGKRSHRLRGFRIAACGSLRSGTPRGDR